MNRLTFKEKSGFYGVTEEDINNLKDFMEEEKFLNLEDLKLFVKFSKNNSYNVIPILEYYREEMISKNNKISNLKQQLKEKEAENKILINDEYKRCCKFCSAFDEQEAIAKEYYNKYENLKLQLAEKEKEIKELQYNFDVAKNELTRLKKNWNISRCQQRKLYDNLKKNQNHNKIKFAIEQLENLKNEFGKPSFEIYSAFWINREINQQISELEQKESQLKTLKM